MSSTPTSSPSISSTEFFSPARAPVDLENVDSSEVFSKCKELMNSAARKGHILNWANRSVSKPLLWLWPLNDDGEPYLASMLDWAYRHYEFTPPCCPCNTRDPNPHAMHFAKIWVVHKVDSPYHRKVVLGCQGHYTGCGIFVPLENLRNNPRLPTARYPRRHTLKLDGLPGFDDRELLQPWEKDPYMQRPPTPLTPSPPRHFIPPTRKTGFTTARGQKRVSTNIPTLPFLLSSPKKTRHSPSDCSDDEVERALSFPPCAQPRLALSSPPISNDSNSSISKDKASGAKYVEPSERWFGDTHCLFEPPEPHYAIQKNSDVPPLAGEELMSALVALQSGEGITSDNFWRLYDKCDCSLLVRKDMLKIHLVKYCPLSVKSAPAPLRTPPNPSLQISPSLSDSQTSSPTPVIRRSINSSPASLRHPNRGTMSYSGANEFTPLRLNAIPAPHPPLTPRRAQYHMPHTGPSGSRGEPPLLWDHNSTHHSLMAYLASGPAYMEDQLESNLIGES